MHLICPLLAVALLTRKIADLAVHLRTHRKDYSSRRWVGQRPPPQRQRPAHSRLGLRRFVFFEPPLLRRLPAQSAQRSPCLALPARARSGLEAMLTQRRKLLQYLRRARFDAYAVLISRLGLKDAYGPQDRFSARYKVRAVRRADSMHLGWAGVG